MNVTCRDEIKSLQPYKPGKPIADVQKEYGLSHVIKMASNENPLGSSPKAIEALKTAIDKLAIYPDGNATMLKEAIAKKLNIKAEQVLPSNGSDEMVDMISKAYVSHGDEVIMADITFPRYKATTIMMGGTPIVVPLKNWVHDLDAMLAAITPKTKIIWLCNPNNPTGTMFTENELIAFLDKVPDHILVVYDEAYREFVTREDYLHDSMKLLAKYENVLIMRTFAKMYGLAGIRVGYTMGHPDIITDINRIRCPFNVNELAQVAAIAALEDTDFVKECYEVNVAGKLYLYEALEAMGLTFEKSETNHIWIDATRNAQEVFIELQKKGVIIRPFMDTWIRVSIGTMEENKTFIETFKALLAQ